MLSGPPCVADQALFFSLILPGIESIVRACTWERCTISTRPYLWVVALSDGEVFSLGPVVAAQ